jgi:sulfhydrogenase subunit delta
MMKSGENNSRTYLGVPVNKPAAAFFDFSSCEGCQLQIINNESSLLDFLSLVKVVNFREAMTEASDAYDIAFVEGCITRADEIERLKAIRRNAKVLVAFGSCACFGGVNQLKNRFRDPAWVKNQVYGAHPIATNDTAQPIESFVPVDLKIYGCPVKKEEVERIVTSAAVGRSFAYPKYPVCMECKAHGNNCLFDLGEPCLGPITRAGCDAWCPTNRSGCWGCRGPADDANVAQMRQIMAERGFSMETMLDRLECFGGFAEDAEKLRSTCKPK